MDFSIFSTKVCEKRGAMLCCYMEISIYLSVLSRSISDHHLRCGGLLYLEFYQNILKQEKHIRTTRTEMTRNRLGVSRRTGLSRTKIEQIANIRVRKLGKIRKLRSDR